MIYLVLIAAQFAFNLAPPDIAWSVGWNMHNITIAVLSAILWMNTRNSLTAILSMFCAVAAIGQWFGLTLDAHYNLAFVLSLFFLIWAVKQAIIPRLKSDPISHETYMYGLGPVDSLSGMINVLRPRTWAEYGSRVVRAGDDIYLCHRGSFKKKKIADLSKSKLELYTWVDTNVKINQKDSSILDNKLNERFIILTNDCSSLRVSRSLGYTLVKRFLDKVLRYG